MTKAILQILGVDTGDKVLFYDLRNRLLNIIHRRGAYVRFRTEERWGLPCLSRHDGVQWEMHILWE